MDKDDPKRVAEWYDTLSRSYDQLYGPEQTLKHDRVVEFLKAQRFQALVDIGCGTGQFLQRAQTLYEYGVGIDVSRRMLEYAKQRNQEKIDLVQAISSHLPIKKAAVDCTVSISTAKADPNLSDLIRDVCRISTPNSFLIITVFQRSADRCPEPLRSANQSFRISERETLYIFRLNCASDWSGDIAEPVW